MLSSHLLAVHRTVVAEGSLTRAATTLGYTVSAISQQLARLEAQAGVALFEKVGRGVRPTQAGLLLAEHASRVLHEITEAETALSALRDGHAGRLRVVSFHSAGESLLPPAIATLRVQLPQLHVHPIVDEAPGALRRLRAGEADLVIMVESYSRDDAPDDDLHRWHLLDDEYRVLLPHDHPLSRLRTVPVEALADTDWIVTVAPPDYVRETTVAICRRAGFSPRIIAEADEFPVTQGYVAAGLGAALFPLLALGAVRSKVAVRKLAPPPRPRHIWLATRPVLAEQPAVHRMVEALQEAAAVQPARRTSHRSAPPP
ncbi:MAG: LysR family transcriptional regulator [Actinomycetota bacterium]|nr:LysR family transcriptional regulator [Actinomycetota bacterium]